MEERRFLELDAKLSELSLRRQGEDPRITAALEAELEAGWIHHDNALEGCVFSREEIEDALTGVHLVDKRESARYERIREYKAALDFVKKLGRARASQPAKGGLITIQLLRQLHELLTSEETEKGSPYRVGNPPHRTYHHAIAPAQTIPVRMRQLCEQLAEEPRHHQVECAASAHFELMAIYPWAQNSGKVARLVMNLLLLRSGYPPAVISGFERQRYYESLHDENGRLVGLVVEALTSYCIHANLFFDALGALRL